MSSIDSDSVFLEQAPASNRPPLEGSNGVSSNGRGTTRDTASADEAEMDQPMRVVGRPRSRSLYATARPLVYITRRVPQGGVDVLLPTCNVSQWDSEEAVPRGELLQYVQGVHGILCLPSDIIDAQVLEAAGPDLCVVATLSEDTQHIDVEECERRKIQVLRCPPADLVAKADLTVALILLTMRNQCANIPMDNRPHNSTCDLFTLPGKASDVTSALWNNVTRRKTFGVYGMTSLGFAVAAKLRNLGANDIMVTDFGHGVEEVENRLAGLNLKDFEVVTREQFLERADIVCVCDSRASTQNEAVFDTNTFQSMKPGVIVVNSDSGHALNYTALYEALRDGKIMAAGLNTCNQTAVPYQYPLQGLKNCVFMPQTQEDRSDLRHKITVGVTTNLLNALKQNIALKLQ